MTVNKVRVELVGNALHVYNIVGDQGNRQWKGPKVFLDLAELPGWMQASIAMLDLANADRELFTPTISLEGIGYTLKGTNIYYLDYKGEE